jgi:uncharacterized surface protein with fasciclin (FAS1) repeats
MTYTCNALKRNAAAFTLGLGLAMAPLMATGALAKLVGGAEMHPTKNIVENAVNSKDHETLVKAVKAAGLVDTLSGKGPFTVFAPTDKAFAKLHEKTLKDLLKPENKDRLRQHFQVSRLCDRSDERGGCQDDQGR